MKRAIVEVTNFTFLFLSFSFLPSASLCLFLESVNAPGTVAFRNSRGNVSYVVYRFTIAGKLRGYVSSCAVEALPTRRQVCGTFRNHLGLSANRRRVYPRGARFGDDTRRSASLALRNSSAFARPGGSRCEIRPIDSAKCEIARRRTLIRLIVSIRFLIDRASTASVPRVVSVFARV